MLSVALTYNENFYLPALQIPVKKLQLQTRTQVFFRLYFWNKKGIKHAPNILNVTPWTTFFSIFLTIVGEFCVIIKVLVPISFRHISVASGSPYPTRVVCASEVVWCHKNTKRQKIRQNVTAQCYKDFKETRP